MTIVSEVVRDPVSFTEIRRVVGYYYDPTSGQYQPMPGTQNNVTPGSLAAEINAAPPGVPVPGLSSGEQNAIFAASNPSLFQGPGGAYSGGPTGDPALYAYFQSLNAAKK